MSDSDIRRVLGKGTRIIKYNQIDDYSSVDDLLGPRNFVIILLETAIQNGHWEAVLRYGNTVEVFDSYGLGIDKNLKFVPSAFRKIDDEWVPHLQNLLDDCPYHVIYNKTDLQKWSPDVSTCGRWCCYRILNINKTLPEFLALVKAQTKKYNLTGDELVCKLIK
jgi:hypothetical protein